MKKSFHKISSFLLAVLVLLSTTSFILDAHFCGDSLVDFSLIQHVDGCGMENPANDSDCDQNISKSSCCTDLQLVRQGQDQVQLTSSDISIDQQIFIISYVSSYLNLFGVLDINIIPFRDYSPPLLIWDIQKTYETYLI